MDVNKLTAVLRALIARTNDILKELGREPDNRTFIPQTVVQLHAAIVEEDKLYKRFKLELDSQKTLTEDQQAQIAQIIAEHNLENETSDEDALERELRAVRSLGGRALIEYAQRVGLDHEKYSAQTELRGAICKKLKDRDLA